MPTEEMTYRAFVREKLESIEAQTKVTNGKVKKLTIALVLVAGIVVGQTMSNEQIIALLSHIL